jgi:hypothetical protein
MKTLQERRDYWKKWVAANSERYRESQKKWNAKNRDRCREHGRAYYWRNKELNIDRSYNKAQQERESFQQAFLKILERLFERPEFSSITPIREPWGKTLSYTKVVCSCGQIFYTDGNIPQHICKP